MSRDYDPTDWYFLLPDGRIYSTARRGFVDVGDGEATSMIDSVARIIEVLGRAGVPQLAPLNAWHVRAECQRRILALMGARDLQHCIIKQLNANMRANALNDKQARGETLTAQEQAEAATLRALAAAIEGLRACSNAMEPDPPADYSDNARWV